MSSNKEILKSTYRLKYINYDKLLILWKKEKCSYMKFSKNHRIKLIKFNVYQFIYKIYE